MRLRLTLGLRRGTGVLTALGVVLAVLAGAQPAAADTAPVNPAEPVTYAADALATVQIDGVVWGQAIVGNTVYAVGSFATARPAGSAPGVNTVVRQNMLAYDLTTGALITSFAPAFDAQVTSVSASPDGSRVYVGGDFTHVGSASRYRVAGFDTATGALLTSFAPVVNARVSAVTATNSAVYVGGIFTAVGAASRVRVAAVDASTGAVLPFTATPGSGEVSAFALSPDGSQIVIGGSFTSVNGSSSPGYGLARLNAATGAMLPLAVNGLVRDAGTASEITSLSSDAGNFYGSGYVFGAGGNLEGSFAASWSTGALVWVEDCHGDTYGVFAGNNVEYTVGHAHYCGNIGGFPQTWPWTFYYGIAFTTAATGTVGNNPYTDYVNWQGNPSPTLLNYFPTFTPGTFTGKSQATWTVTGNADYLLYGGEFTFVNGVRQQGLVRMATRSIAPNKEGPRLAGAAFDPQVASVAAGTARISWPGNYDRDNATLVYRLYRGDMSTVIDARTLTAPFWKLPLMGFVDSGLTPGSTQRYRISATDPLGNVALSDWVSVTISSDAISGYARTILGDSPAAYWRLGESDSSTVNDWAGFMGASGGTGVTGGAAGAVIGDPNTASTFNGSSTASVSTNASQPAPDTFTTEAWVKTTSTSGGKIIGFGDAPSGSSASYDRHVYMDNAGHIWFGVYAGAVQTVNSAGAYNDGQWHQVVASLGANGMRLDVDGKRVAQRTDVTAGQPYSGYWRIGGDNVNGWTNKPTSGYLNGVIDEVAVYPAVLTPLQVAAHYVASGRVSPVKTAPTDAYGAAVDQAGPDLYWRVGEASGTTAADASINASAGTYRAGVTFGAPGAVGGTTDTAVTFDGSSGSLSSNAQFGNPTTYSEELWFSTTTTNGGKLIGFGDNQTALSSNYDRHVYLENNGRLTFGVWAGQQTKITSPLAYNDGKWHHMVATQSSAGMVLYVDGAVVGTNPLTSAQNFAGYWKVGGDTPWGSQPYFAGKIDEVAVYSTALSAAAVASHYALGSSGQVLNQAPTAAFTTTTANLAVQVDGTASRDPDGSVAGYAWDFGDGATATGASASHAYAASGTFTVKLTVTDNQGATGTLSHAVTVPGPLVGPPFGALDAVTPVPGGAQVTGWAIDPVAAGGTSQVHVYVDGHPAAALTATGDRPDVGGAFPAFGPLHGYTDAVTGLAAGQHTICVYAVRPGTGPNPLLGCRLISTADSPIGNLDGVVRAPGGARVRGWALDSSTSTSITTHTYASGQFAGALVADSPRSDIARAFPGYGDAHGVDGLVSSSGGLQTLCLYGLDAVAPGANSLLGCRSVFLAVDPFGSLDAVTRSGNTIGVRGWTIDPDTAASGEVHVYVDGVGAAILQAGTARPDVSAGFPDYASAPHGFAADAIAVSAGAHRVCAYAINVAGSGSSTLLGCASV